MANLDERVAEHRVWFLDEIQDELECVVCLDIPSSDPVYQCDHGHILCNFCHETLTKCPVCDVKLGSTRCLVVEKVLAKCRRPCEFNNYGCDIQLANPSREAHLKLCIYKPLQCPSLNCTEFVPILQILEHMDKEHQNHRKVDTSTFIATFYGIREIIKNKRSLKFEPVRIKLENRYFFSECWRTCKGRWYIWLYMLGTPSESKSYIFTAKIIKTNHIEELSYTGQSVSLHVGPDEISTLGRCLTFNDEVAKHFYYDDSIVIHVDVRRNPTA